MLTYFSLFKIPSILWSRPTSFQEKHLHTLIDPSPCFTTHGKFINFNLWLFWFYATKCCFNRVSCSYMFSIESFFIWCFRICHRCKKLVPMSMHYLSSSARFFIIICIRPIMCSISTLFFFVTWFNANNKLETDIDQLDMIHYRLFLNRIHHS